MVGNAVTILLVEDNPGDARHLEEMLEEARVFPPRLVHVARLSEAIERMRSESFDVVLLDLSLPDASGAETVARLHAARPSVPIVVVTGIDDETVAMEAMAAGAEDYLVKGQVGASLLSRALRYAIQRKRAEENAHRLMREKAARAEAEASEKRAMFLAEAGRSLADSLDVDATLAEVARLAVPILGDLCVVDVLDDGGDVRRLAGAAATPERNPMVERALKVAPDVAFIEHPVVRALLTGEPYLVNDAGPIEREALGAEDDGETRAVMSVPLCARGRTLGAMTVCSVGGRRYHSDDLSLALELASRAALALDTARLYRAREDMMSVVSHDLRNPLNVIGFAVASMKRPQVTDEQRKSCVEKIRRAADRMNHLIEDLLDIARIEGGRLPIERSGQPVHLLVADAAEMMRSLAEEKGLRLTIRPGDELVAVDVDRERVLQVFSNLIGNAIKFTPTGGAITLTAELRDSEVVFAVLDTGPGIKKEDLARIFDRFWQARRRDRQGAGLGLSIAKGIVGAHGGNLWAESVFGEGTRFAFTLPLANDVRPLDALRGARTTPSQRPPKASAGPLMEQLRSR